MGWVSTMLHRWYGIMGNVRGEVQQQHPDDHLHTHPIDQEEYHLACCFEQTTRRRSELE